MASNKKKLIVIKPNGNHSNRLLQNLHFEVFCKEHNIEYQNPTFSDMKDFYIEPCYAETNLRLRILQIDLLGKLFRHSRIVKKIFSIVWIISKLGLLKFIRFDKANKESECETLLLKAFEKNNVIYTAGWKFRVPQLSEKYNHYMAYKYSLKESLYKDNRLVKNIDDLKIQDYTLIGVHIRRGDYKKWKGGIYYFNDNVYRKYMDRISEQLSQQGKDKQMFILFSNGQLCFEESANILISKENWFIDQHIMSKCNYLIGPPSSFTLWASYVGNVKIFQIFDSKDKVDLTVL